MIQLDCPNCGNRNALEFRYGGEYNPRPSGPETEDARLWNNYLYIRRNQAGVQQEWWYHRSGCQLWFLAERDTRTNQVYKTYRWSPPEQTTP